MTTLTTLKDLTKIRDQLNEKLDEIEQKRIENEKQNESITTEMLDEIAKSFAPKPNTDKAFEDKLVAVLISLVNLFGDDSNEVIIQAKLGDQITRMFEKMADNVLNEGQRLKRELKTLNRQDVGIEITQNQVEDKAEQISKMRYQYAILNWCFKICLTKFRPQVKGITGIDFGQYTRLKDMPKVVHKIKQGRKLTLDTLINDRDLFMDISNQEGIVEMPEDLQ